VQGQLSLFRAEVSQSRSPLLTPFEEHSCCMSKDDKASEFYVEASMQADNVLSYCNLGIIELDSGNMIGALETLLSL